MVAVGSMKKMLSVYIVLADNDTVNESFLPCFQL